MSLSRNIKLFQWHEFFVNFVLWAPFAIIYFSKVTGSYALGLSIFSVVQITAALFELPTGILSDFVGRRKTMIFGAIAYVFAFVLYAVGQFYWVLILGAILEGLARSFYSGNNEALLYDSLKEDNKTEELASVMGKIGSMSQWGLAVSGLLGGFIASWSLNLVMWLAVVPQLICLVLAWMIRDGVKVKNDNGNIYIHLKESVNNFLKNERLRLLSLSDILGFGMGESMYLFRSAFVASIWPVWAIGVSQVLSNIGAAISFRFAGAWIKKYKAIVWLLVGGIYSRVAYLIGLFFPSVLSPALMASTSLFFGVGIVAKSSLLQTEFSDKQRATMGSLNSFAGSVFFAMFAVFLGLLADMSTPRTAMIVVTLMQFVTVWIQWRLYKKGV